MDGRDELPIMATCRGAEKLATGTSADTHRDPTAALDALRVMMTVQRIGLPGQPGYS